MSTWLCFDVVVIVVVALCYGSALDIHADAL
jgi:hypothetical protein